MEQRELYVGNVTGLKFIFSQPGPDHGLSQAQLPAVQRPLREQSRSEVQTEAAGAASRDQQATRSISSCRLIDSALRLQ